MNKQYLAKFDAEGRRLASIPLDYCEDYGGEEMLLAEGYVTISEEDWHHYVGNMGDGDNGTGYIRDADTGKPVSAPPYAPTIEEQTNDIAARYGTQITELKDALATATLAGDDETADELRGEYAELMTEYQAALEAIQNDEAL